MLTSHKIFTVLITFLFACLAPVHGIGQATDNNASYSNIPTGNYARLNYENDVFTGTDRYYTGGVALEWVSPWLKKSPVNKLLVQPVFGHTKYGITLIHNSYTPVDITRTDILFGDRPFAACLLLESFQITTATEKHRRISVALSTGIIGQGAGSEVLQTFIHRHFTRTSPVPKGWHNQINNDIILNYEINYEKQLFSYAKLLSIDVNARARAGTLSNKAGTGATIIFGHLYNPFLIARGHHFQAYVYDHAEVSIVAYDATMQGGLFDRSSPYTIKQSDISTITFQNRFGFVTDFRGFRIEFFRSFLTREFRTGNNHHWGGFQFTFAL